MPNKDRSFHESPEKAGGEGWLYSEQQKSFHINSVASGAQPISFCHVGAAM